MATSLAALDTAFAPAERAPREELERAAREFSRRRLLEGALDAAGVPVAVLDRHRQIVHANRPFVELLGAGSADEIVGLRPGEAMRCVHADEGPGGCGTSPACAHCGAVLAILGTAAGRGSSQEECRLLRRTADGLEALELRVTATPLAVDGNRFTVLALDDVTAARRREALERIFFHDVLNTLAGVAGWAGVVVRTAEGPAAGAASRLLAAARELEEEIRAQRDLAAAEAGRLEPRAVPVQVDTLLDRLAERFAGHPALAGRRLVIRRAAPTDELVTDPVLALRVLGNMVKNALEATPEEGTVRVTVEADPLAVAFHVANPGVMPREVQRQLFHRSFSTKGPGRGLGTWSMKLLGERYLRGRITFASDEVEGTVFTFTLPRRPPAA